jgi:hypothetical protein
VADGLEPTFSAALGAALGLDGTLDEMLLTPALEHAFVAAVRRRLVTWSIAAVATVCIAIGAAGVSRDRLLSALEAELSTARRSARAGSNLAVRTLLIDREMAAITTTTAARPDVLTALAQLGVRLPVEAVAQRVRMVGAEWQVEGNAKTAAAVLAALAAEPRFEKVRFLAPSNRFRDGTDDRETFAIAFALR